MNPWESKNLKKELVEQIRDHVYFGWKYFGCMVVVALQNDVNNVILEMNGLL